MTRDHWAAVVSPDPHSQVRCLEGARVEIERARGLSPVAGDVCLLDISPQGVRLVAPTCLELHEPIVLAIEIPGLRRALSRTATVRWRQPAPGAAWRLGCTFGHDLPEDVVQELVALGRIDRRRGRRQAVDLAARARSETTEDTVAARIVSLSPGGVRITCSQPATIGDPLVLELDLGDTEPVTVRTRVIWQRPVDGQHLIGCSLAGPADYERLRDCVDPAAPDRAEATDARSVFKWTMLVALPAVLLAAFFLLLGSR